MTNRIWDHSKEKRGNMCAKEEKTAKVEKNVRLLLFA